MSKKNKIKRKRKLIFGGAVFILCIAAIVFVSKNTKVPIPHLDATDFKISQYSDIHITDAAFTTNPQFKDIAFNKVAPRRSYPFSGQIAAVIDSIKSLMTPAKKTETQEYGTWIWTPVLNMTPEYMEQIVSGAKTDGINAIYVSIDSYLDIFTMEKGEQRDSLKKSFADKLEYFIELADKNGIKVDAEAGWRNWAEEGNEYKGFAIINFVRDFNAAHEHKFRGFQYDIEPYLLESYTKDPAPVLKNFVSLIDKTQNFMGTNALRFSVVVPDFYDKKDSVTPKFSYNGKKDYAFSHILNILDKRPDSSIIIMSYRNFAEGKNGSIEISQNEMDTAKRSAYNTKIIIAQETGEVSPSYITFHNTPKKYLHRQIQKINVAFENHPNFSGIAIHYANAFLAMK